MIGIQLQDVKYSKMPGQKYMNFEEDDTTPTAQSPPGNVPYDPTVAFKAGSSYWQKRTLLERALIIFLGVCLLVILILGVILGTKQAQLTKLGNLCTDKTCITVSSNILNAMDQTIDPCEDFYQYSCGGWLKSHPIPSGQSAWGTFGEMWKKNQLVMRNAVERPLNATQVEAEQKAMLYYTSCMDPNDTIDELGSQPIKDLLSKLGGWSVSQVGEEKWDPTDWDFQSNIEELHSYGLSSLFSLWVSEDEKDPTKNILQLDQSGLSLAREQYLNKSIEEDKTLSAYLKYNTDLGVLLGGDYNETRQYVIDVIEFEQQLANITTPSEERRDDEKLYHKMTIAEVQELAPFMNWLNYLNSLLTVTTYSVTSAEEVIVFAPEYLTQMSALVSQMYATDEGKTTLNNYMKWQIFRIMVPYLSEDFREAQKEFSKVITGVEGEEEKWRMCVSDANSALGYALGAMFVRTSFLGDSKEKAEQMIELIKQAFKANLPKLAWMDEETRKLAIEKADGVIDMIGFPSFILNATLLNDRYQDLTINNDEYFLNNVRDLKYAQRRNLLKLRKVPDKLSWSMTPPTVNAYYTPYKNEIVFPAGILQAPFYDHNYPKSLNFGGMGVVMGHELTHGFDDEGREYDKYGVLRPWWNNDSVVKFKKQAQCLVDQYSNYSINGENLKGKQTLGENIADNGGLKAAYHAYIDWVKKNGQERPLPGITLSHKQLFFVAFAQVWCTNSKPEADHLSILTDPHSPAKFRVIGTISNVKEFADQFNCKKDTAMNPSDKCEVW